MGCRRIAGHHGNGVGRHARDCARARRGDRHHDPATRSQPMGDVSQCRPGSEGSVDWAGACVGHHLDGVPSNPVVGGREITLASVGRNAQGFAAETDPISPAVSIFDYARDTEEGPGIIRSSGSGALAVETSIYKLVYLSFGMEGIEPLEERVQVLLDVLSWFKEPGVDKGDVDGNGTTDIIDAVVAVNIVLGVHQANERELARADMNYDGAIDIIDVVKVVNAVLGISGKSGRAESTDM